VTEQLEYDKHWSDVTHELNGIGGMVGNMPGRLTWAYDLACFGPAWPGLFSR